MRHYKNHFRNIIQNRILQPLSFFLFLIDASKNVTSLILMLRNNMWNPPWKIPLDQYVIKIRLQVHKLSMNHTWHTGLAHPMHPEPENHTNMVTKFSHGAPDRFFGNYIIPLLFLLIACLRILDTSRI